MWQGGARDGHQSEEVHVELASDVGVREFLDGTEMTVAGVVHDDVDATERRDGVVDHAVRRRRVGHVERSDEQSVIRGLERVEGLQVPCRSHHPIPDVQGGPADRLAEATGGPCHQPHPALVTAVHQTSLHPQRPSLLRAFMCLTGPRAATESKRDPHATIGHPEIVY